MARVDGTGTAAGQRPHGAKGRDSAVETEDGEACLPVDRGTPDARNPSHAVEGTADARLCGMNAAPFFPRTLAPQERNGAAQLELRTSACSNPGEGRCRSVSVVGVFPLSRGLARPVN